MFLQTDPVPGGSANPYDYCDQDPINCDDLAGTFSIGHFIEKHWKAIAQVAVFSSCLLLSPAACFAASAALAYVTNRRAHGGENRASFSVDVGFDAVGSGLGRAASGSWTKSALEHFGKHALGHGAGSLDFAWTGLNAAQAGFNGVATLGLNTLYRAQGERRAE